MIKFLKKYWLIILVLSLAAFCRLYRIQDYMEFLGDQGRDVIIVRNFLQNHDPFFIGPQTSIGNMYLGPFYYYLFVVPGLILTWFNPVGPSIIVALLGVLTVYLLYQYSQKWFNSTTAIIVGVLYAISPVVIKYSNFSWNPNVMPLFALIFFNYLLNSQIALASLAFIVCLNSHYLALLLVPVGLIIVGYNYFKKTKDRPKIIKQTIIGFIFFLISLTPQVLFDIKHQGQNINALIAFFTQRETTVSLKPYKAIPQIGPLFVQINTRLLAGKNEDFGLYLSVLFVALLIIEVYYQIKSKKVNFTVVFLSVWYLVGLVGLALYKQHIYDHYFGFLFPVVFLLFGYLLSKTPRYIFIPVLLITIAFSLIENPFRWEPNKQMATTSQISQLIIDQSQGRDFNFALLSKMGWGFSYYLVNQKNYYEIKDKLTDQLFVVCVPFQIECNPINNPEWGVAAFGWAKIDNQWEINGIKVFRLIHAK